MKIKLQITLDSSWESYENTKSSLSKELFTLKSDAGVESHHLINLSKVGGNLVVDFTVELSSEWDSYKECSKECLEIDLQEYFVKLGIIDFKVIDML